jgi:hypothetical protein
MRQPSSETELEALARRLTVAAVEITGDDPLRGTPIQAIAEHLGLADRTVIESGIAEAARRGWLRPSGGFDPHSVSVTAAWRRERAPRGKAILTFRTHQGGKRGL